MASAGRILIIPRGSWNAETEYDFLDLVFQNGTSWLARIPSVGIEPSDENERYWFKMCIGADLSDYLSLSGGTVKGPIGLGNGTGVVSASYEGAYLQAGPDAEDEKNVKLKISRNVLTDCLNLLQKNKDGSTATYQIFGQHNLETLLSTLQPMLSDLKCKTGTYVGDYPVALHSDRSKAINTGFESTQLLLIIGKALADTGVTSFTVAIPALEIGITHSKDGIISLATLNAVNASDGTSVVLMDNSELSSIPVTNVCNRERTQYYWIAIAKE